MRKLLVDDGLRRIMKFIETKESRYNYEYKDNIVEQFGEIFKLEHLKI